MAARTFQLIQHMIKKNHIETIEIKTAAGGEFLGVFAL